MKVGIRIFALMASIAYIVTSTASAETVTYYVSDHLGSPVVAMDSGGTVLWRESYNPYGEKRNNPSSADDDTGYTGHPFDAATDLTYMQARYYDPIVGRFMGVDPVGFYQSAPMSFGKYSYVFNNPFRFVDPFGLMGSLTGTFKDNDNRTNQNTSSDIRVMEDGSIKTGVSINVGKRPKLGIGDIVRDGQKDPTQKVAEVESEIVLVFVSGAGACLRFKCIEVAVAAKDFAVRAWRMTRGQRVSMAANSMGILNGAAASTPELVFYNEILGLGSYYSSTTIVATTEITNLNASLAYLASIGVIASQ